MEYNEKEFIDYYVEDGVGFLSHNVLQHKPKKFVIKDNILDIETDYSKFKIQFFDLPDGRVQLNYLKYDGDIIAIDKTYLTTWDTGGFIKAHCFWLLSEVMEHYTKMEHSDGDRYTYIIPDSNGINRIYRFSDHPTKLSENIKQLLEAYHKTDVIFNTSVPYNDEVEWNFRVGDNLRNIIIKLEGHFPTNALDNIMVSDSTKGEKTTEFKQKIEYNWNDSTILFLIKEELNLI